MFVTLTSHGDAFTLANLLVPGAIWVTAEGDVGQCNEDDIALEDTETEAILILRADGAATFSHHRLLCVTTTLRGKYRDNRHS